MHRALPPPRLNNMVSAIVAVAFLALCASISAVELFSYLDQPGSATTSAQAVQVLLPLAAMGALSTAVAFIHRHLHRAAAACAGNRRLSELVTFVVCASAGTLEPFFFSVQPAGGVDDVGALGVAAVHVLPAAATGTFFLGVALILARVCAASGGAVAGDGPIQAAAWRLVTKIALGAAAALIGLMAMALYIK